MTFGKQRPVRSWQRDDFADVAWRAYCPNAAMLNAIGECPG